MSDKRNYEVTNKIYDILDNIKGFDVATSKPKNGKIIMRYGGVNFYLTIEPMFNDNEAGKEEDSKPFDQIVQSHMWVFDN